MISEDNKNGVNKYENIINHIAFIMDGNGRWAKAHNLPRNKGHAKGVDTFKHIVSCCLKRNIHYMTFYAFSTENWNRPKEEVDNLFKLMEKFIKDIHKNNKEKCKLVFIGSKENLPVNLVQKMLNIERETSNFNRAIILIAFNYGSREEILHAVNLAVKSGKILSQYEFENLLFTKHIPNPDIVVRTGGEIRLSNFMAYQIIYSELFFTNTLWPDFEENELDEIIFNYKKRIRKFGK